MPKMRTNVDFTIADSGKIEAALCEQLENIRLSRNMTQKQLADEAGLSTRTIGRLAKGAGVSLDTFIRVLIALGIQQNLDGLLPDPTVRPMERIATGGTERKRARPKEPEEGVEATWTWGDEGEENE